MVFTYKKKESGEFWCFLDFEVGIKGKEMHQKRRKRSENEEKKKKKKKKKKKIMKKRFVYSIFLFHVLIPFKPPLGETSEKSDLFYCAKLVCCHHIQREGSKEKIIVFFFFSIE